MTKAAEGLGIPQSSMSRRINALQTVLHLPLLIHDGRTVRLTPEAHRLAARARGPLDELDQILAEITGDADPDHGTVRFGFPLTMGTGTIPDLLAAFRRKYPGIRVLLKQAHGAELEADLLAGHLDLAVIIPAPKRLHHIVIGEQRIYAVLPAKHHLAAAPKIDLEALDGEVFIANPSSYNLRRLTETWCHDAGYDADIAIEVTEFATIRELVSRSLGIALLPHDDLAPKGIVEIPFTDDRYARSIALASATSSQSPPTRRLSDYLLGQFEQPRSAMRADPRRL